MVLFLNNDNVSQVLTMKDCLEELAEGRREVWAGDAVARPRIDVWAPCDVPDAYWQWGSMEATSKKWRVFALRVKSDIAYFEQTPNGVWTHEYFCQEPGKFCGLILLFSLKNGEPLAIINDGIIQHMRVGAGAGLLAKHLAVPDARTVGMLGSGGMARVHAMAFKEVRPIQRIQVYSPTRANREAYAREMSPLLDVEFVPVDRPEDAVRGAQIVSCCTDSIVPVLKGEWLEPGMFITTVKGDIEMDETALARLDAAIGSPPDSARQARAAELTGPWSHSMGGAVQAYVAGQPDEIARIPTAQKAKRPDRPIRWISARGLDDGTEVGRLTPLEIIGSGGGGGGGGGRGLEGRQGPSQGTSFSSIGGFVYHRARELGLGREIPTEWFLQDIRN